MSLHIVTTIITWHRERKGQASMTSFIDKPQMQTIPACLIKGNRMIIPVQLDFQVYVCDAAINNSPTKWEILFWFLNHWPSSAVLFLLPAAGSHKNKCIIYWLPLVIHGLSIQSPDIGKNNILWEKTQFFLPQNSLISFFNSWNILLSVEIQFYENLFNPKEPFLCNSVIL